MLLFADESRLSSVVAWIRGYWRTSVTSTGRIPLARPWKVSPPDPPPLLGSSDRIEKALVFPTTDLRKVSSIHVVSPKGAIRDLDQ